MLRPPWAVVALALDSAGSVPCVYSSRSTRRPLRVDQPNSYELCGRMYHLHAEPWSPSTLAAIGPRASNDECSGRGNFYQATQQGPNRKHRGDNRGTSMRLDDMTLQPVIRPQRSRSSIL
ncbi:hypothetical protein BJY00DRAFT_143818 [Aspergillus carlsbadensis]|nr:hypothetical protein BJY00DRAFT_143818 [Aspergillus carlsbadensis]